MTLEQKLLAADEHITDRFQKVADWAYKRIGWDKYDCAALMNQISSVSVVGTGVYQLIDGVVGTMNGDNTGASVPTGLVLTYKGISDFYKYARFNKEMRLLEEENVKKTQAPFPPQFRAGRPVYLGVLPPIMFSVADAVRVPMNYAMAFLGAYSFFLTGADYFCNTTMRPPKKKKTPSDALDWLKEKLTIQKPVLQDVKVQI